MDFHKIAFAVIVCALSAGVTLSAGIRASESTPAFRNPQAKDLYRKALEYGDKGLWAPAILQLNQARTLDPRNPDILIELGVAHGERREWNAALKLLREAIAIAPDSARAHYNLGLTLDRSQPSPGVGIPEYRLALKLDPRNVDALMNLAVDLGDRDAAEAKPLFQRGIRIAPENAKLHLNFALLLRRAAQEDASLAEFRVAIRRDPDLLEARRQLASILMTHRQWPDAIEQFRQIIKRDPDDPAAHYTLGLALTHNGNQDEGKREVELSRELRKRQQEQQDAAELRNAGIRSLRAGDAQQALKSFESAVRLDSGSDNHMYLGLALAASGDNAAGIRELTTALTMDTRNARARVNLGSVYVQSGRIPEAKAEFERALEIDPWSAEAHNNLGMVFASNQQFEQAVRHFQLGADLEPAYLEAVFNLGLALRKLNRNSEAVKAFRRAAEISPDNAQVQYALGLALRNAGDAVGARTALDRATALGRSGK